MTTQHSSRSFAAHELDVVDRALTELADYGDRAAGIHLHRHPHFAVGPRVFPAVTGVFLPGSRTAVLFDGAFAGAGPTPPLSSLDTVRGVLAVSLLGEPRIRRRWLELMRLSEDVPPAAAILEPHALADELGGEAGDLPLERLGPETSFALAFALTFSRGSWLRRRRPHVSGFLSSLRETPALPIRC